MNVSIATVTDDLGTTATGIQTASRLLSAFQVTAA